MTFMKITLVKSGNRMKHMYVKTPTTVIGDMNTVESNPFLEIVLNHCRLKIH